VITEGEDEGEDDGAISCGASDFQAPSVQLGMLPLLGGAFLTLFGRRRTLLRRQREDETLAGSRTGGLQAGAVMLGVAASGAAVILVGVATLLAGCGGDEEEVTPSPAPSSGQTMDEGINGTITDSYGHPVPDAAVSLRGHPEIPEVRTDDRGAFSLPMPGDLDGSPLELMAQAPGMAPNIKVLTPEPGVPGLAVSLALDIPEMQVIDADLGGTLVYDDVTLTFPPGALVFEDNRAERVQGLVEVWVNEFFPGDHEQLPVPSLDAIAADDGGPLYNTSKSTAAEDELETQMLATYGMLGVELLKDGIGVNVADDSSVLIELQGAASRYLNPLNNNASYEIGDPAPLYHLGDGETVWELWDATGWEVLESSDGSGKLSFFASVPHFSYWNLDVGVAATRLAGNVFTQTVGGTVVWNGVEVNIRGYNRSGGEWHTYGWTNTNGDYCIRVGADTPNVEIWFEARFKGVTYKVVEYTSTGSVGGEPSCDSPSTNIHNHEIPCEWFEANGLLSCLGY